MNDPHQGKVQQAVYACIVAYMQAESRPPTIREIGQALGIASTGHVDHHVTMLEKRGLITRQKGTSRGIKLTQPAGVPVIGTIAAGTPLDLFDATSQAREMLPIKPAFQADQVFALLVRGRSMIEDAICDGDYVIIRPQDTCENGDIVVATHLQSGVSGSATLKRFFLEQEQVRLQPANADMAPLVIEKSAWDQEWKVQGKVIAIFRQC